MGSVRKRNFCEPRFVSHNSSTESAVEMDKVVAAIRHIWSLPLHPQAKIGPLGGITLRIGFSAIALVGASRLPAISRIGSTSSWRMTDMKRESSFPTSVISTTAIYVATIFSGVRKELPLSTGRCREFTPLRSRSTAPSVIILVVLQGLRAVFIGSSSARD